MLGLIESLLWLSLNVYHEARGEDQLGQIAVAHVTLNRKEVTGTTIKEVVLAQYQFSWTHQLQDYTPSDIKAFLLAVDSALTAAGGYDFTQGATFYHSKAVDPKWAKDMVLVDEIGKHIFYIKD